MKKQGEVEPMPQAAAALHAAEVTAVVPGAEQLLERLHRATEC